MIISLKNKGWALLTTTLVLSIIGFVGKEILERTGAIPSCVLFHVEQWFFVLTGVISLGLLFWNHCGIKIFLSLVMFGVFLSGGIVALYHAGVQYRYFPMPKAPCQTVEVKVNENATPEEKLAAFLSMAPVKPLKLFHIPVAFDVFIMMILGMLCSAGVVARCTCKEEE